MFESDYKNRPPPRCQVSVNTPGEFVFLIVVAKNTILLGPDRSDRTGPGYRTGLDQTS